MRDQLGDAEILVTKRRPEIALHHAGEVAAVLREQRTVEPVRGVEIGADRGRQRLLLVEGSTGRETDDEERNVTRTNKVGIRPAIRRSV